MRIHGLDLSLTSTGVACTTTRPGRGIRTDVITTTSKTGRYERLRFIRREVMSAILGADLVVLEDQPTHTPSPATMKALAELHGVVGVALHEAGVPVARVNVSTLKMYATGKGNAKKADMMLAAYKHFGREFGTDDECDAFWLVCMGIEHVGGGVLTAKGSPRTVRTNRAAIEKVEWPVTGA